MSELDLAEAFEDLTSTPAPSRYDAASISATSRRRRRNRTLLAAGAVLALVGGTVLLVDHPDDRTADPLPPVPTPELSCPSVAGGPISDRGAPVLDAGATAARLCPGGTIEGVGPMPPFDIVTTNLDSLVRSVNSQPEGFDQGCSGPMGPTYALMLAYPGGTVRKVILSLSGCGTITVGTINRHNPYKPYETFMALVGEQRKTATPPTATPAPTCLQQNARLSPVAKPAEMVAARLCVTYNGNAEATSVDVPASDLRTILNAWSDGPRTSTEKGPGCGPTVPTWVLSGVTRWGDSTQITAECNRPTNGDDWIEFDALVQAVVDRLVSEAGVKVDDGTNAGSAWMLAKAWLDAVNAMATVSDRGRADEIAEIANNMWVRDPLLPDGSLDWELLSASRIEEPGWREAYRVPARTPTGEQVFVVVRDESGQPWRILRLRPGLDQ